MGREGIPRLLELTILSCASRRSDAVFELSRLRALYPYKEQVMEQIWADKNLELKIQRHSKFCWIVKNNVFLKIWIDLEEISSNIQELMFFI